jgi:diguanylate cyclase (GGDEF)-like protein
MLAALATIALVGWIDYLTGTAVQSVMFYVLPIVLVGLNLERRWVVLTSLLSSLAWTAIEFSTVEFRHPAISIWNEAAALFIFLLVGLTISTVRREQNRLQLANDRINDLLEAATRDARTDPLTDLPNLRHFVENLHLEIARCRRDGKPMCLLYLDLDNFKLVNDRHGHAQGDVVLKGIAEALKRTLRASDLAARLGGDEFAALLWQAELTGSRIVGERVLRAVRELAAPYADCNLGASIGVAWFERPPADPDDALEEADAAMYEAKNEKNKVVVVNVEREPTQIDTGRSTGPV